MTPMIVCTSKVATKHTTLSSTVPFPIQIEPLLIKSICLRGDRSVTYQIRGTGFVATVRTPVLTVERRSSSAWPCLFLSDSTLVASFLPLFSVEHDKIHCSSRRASDTRIFLWRYLYYSTRRRSCSCETSDTIITTVFRIDLEHRTVQSIEHVESYRRYVVSAIPIKTLLSRLVLTSKSLGQDNLSLKAIWHALSDDTKLAVGGAC